MKNKEAIVDYYESCESDYRLFWDLDRSLAMHAGYWDETTRTLPQALQRENEILAELAGINSTDYVLDAGCGVGGSSLFLAQRYGCRVEGITLSAEQVNKANMHARKTLLQNPPRFSVMDYCQTQFPDQTFSVIWGLESICHACNKNEFLREAFRLLKPGGRLIVADGFAIKDFTDSKDHEQMLKWLKGWGVEALETIDKFRKGIMENGFSDCRFKDITSHVIPSSKKLYLISFPAFILSRLGEAVALRTKIQTDNILSAYYQYVTLKKGLWKYGIFFARKNN